MSEEFNPDLVSVIDENGVEHVFEELDRIETDTAKYVALLPVYDEAEEILDDDGELIILKVCEELQDINIILQKANAHVGYRVRDEIVFYMLNNSNDELIMVTLIKTNEMLETEKNELIDTESLIEDFSDVILKIYNTIDMTKENIPALDYIKILLTKV